ncbi:MAG: hypothetical protein AAFY76_00840 [Cyanobacteria bacterium J06649_11]
MSRKVILDRVYAFELINYLREMNGEGNKYSNEEFRNVINWAAIMYDQILIEDHYASSLFELTRDEKWFWNLFVSYSPDKILADDPDLGIALEESVEEDMENRALVSRIKNIKNGKYNDLSKVESLIRNINKTLLLAKEMDAFIIPAHHKMELLSTKNGGPRLFQRQTKPKNVVKNVFELELPFFEVNTLSNLKKIREDKRVKSLRNLLFRLMELDSDSKEDILHQINIEKDEILKTYRPDHSWSLIKYFVGLFGPAAAAYVELMDYTEDLRTLSENGWRFLLIDLRNEQ